MVINSKGIARIKFGVTGQVIDPHSATIHSANRLGFISAALIEMKRL